MNTPTTAQIEALAYGAAIHGDNLMAIICERALNGDTEAAEACADVIAEAKAADVDSEVAA